MNFKCVSGSILLLCSAAAAAAQPAQLRAFASSTQMVAVTTADWNAIDGRMRRYERSNPGKHWKAIGAPITIVVGKNGMGWGRGLLAPDSAGPIGLRDPVKKEGDGKSPAGAFRFSSAFGYAAQPQPGWKLPYIPLTPSVECVDDSASQFYNRIVDRASVSPDWHSSEHMASEGDAYRWGAVIDHNANPPAPAGGSCVFMHIWGGPGVATSGCTAMPEEQLEPVLAWLDPARNPILVQLPFTQYKKLKKPWRLPKPPKP